MCLAYRDPEASEEHSRHVRLISGSEGGRNVESCNQVYSNTAPVVMRMARPGVWQNSLAVSATP